MKYNILITGTSSYGVGEGVLKIANDSKYRSKLRIISTSNNELTAYKNLAEGYYVLPNADQPQYSDEIINIIKNEKINILIPGSESEMLFFSKNKEQFEQQLKIDIWVNPYELVETFNNKMSAEEFFRKHGINTPRSFEPGKGSFPLIVKPIQGKGSEGIFVVYDKDQYQAVYDFYKAMKNRFLVQEFIEKDKEYTVSFINLGNRNEVLCMERILNKGATQYARIVEEPEISNIAATIHRALGQELILNLQILKKKEKFFVFEINPRFSGSAPIRAKLGYNEFDVIFAHKYLNIEHEFELRKDSYCIRGFEEKVYL